MNSRPGDCSSVQWRWATSFDSIPSAGVLPLSAPDVLSLFHPVLQDWFRSRFTRPTDPQLAGWPHIAAGEHTLISAPTGSGKTLTAFFAVIDRLFRQAATGELPDGLQVVYVSPLRALSNDMQRNLEGPLAEIQELATGYGLEIPKLRTGLRTGDTPAYERAKLTKNPPHILVTTPESLYLLLTSARSRESLRSVNTVIVDEIHALVRDKRGSHLALSLERLEQLTERPLQRIGLSATQKPIERMAEFLVGSRGERLGTRERIQDSGFRIQQGEQETPSSFSHWTLDTGHSTPPNPQRSTLNASRPSTLDPRPSSISIIDVGHARDLDLGIEIPPSDLQAVCSHDQWAEVNARIIELINSHRSTLIFVNTRRMAERVTFQLTQMLGEEAVGSHHGSLSKEIRLKTEQQLKNGELKAVVATSSLELGIDVGYIDLVIQLGSPRAIAAFLQRMGRSGHALGLTPKGRLFALTRDELVECMALIRAVRGGRLDVTPIPEAPLDILAQQIVAELASQEWDADELYAAFTRAWPYRDLTRQRFEDVLAMLAQGLTDTGGRDRSLIYYDRVNGKLRGRKAARIAALSNGGAIVELDSVRVVLEDENTVVGSVDEEFGVESSAGDIFLLGNSSWRIRGLRGNDLMVSDARGAPPTIPFWRGEAPGRTIELSEEISRLREEMEEKLVAADSGESREDSGFRIQESGKNPPNATPLNSHPSTLNSSPHSTLDTGHSTLPNSLPDLPTRYLPISRWLCEQTHCSESAARQTVIYMAAQRAAIGLLPTQKRIVFERFFDESGGMQLVVHAPFGGRINRGWGLAFRKRFCRSFDFELQATADDDGFILSLGPQHSFPLETLFPMMRTDNARNLLEQALLVVPMFHLRWRWNVTRSLFVARMRNGKKVAPALQRFRSEDLLTAVFPKLTGCQENIVGDHEIPDHPLVQQTMNDCLFDALDLEGLIEVLGRVQAEEVTLVGRDTREPSPFAYELLNSNPYAFLDGGEVQERRARAVATRRSLSVESVRDLGRLDPAAIDAVVAEAQPEVRDADELHDLLVGRVFLPIWRDSDAALNLPGHLAVCQSQFPEFFAELRDAGRAARVSIAPDREGWVATESWPALAAIHSGAQLDSPLEVPEALRRDWNTSEALVALLRGWMETAGPVSAVQLGHLLSLPVTQVFGCLEAIEGEGLVLRGRFARSEDIPSDSPDIEWCHRRLLARIHRRTISGLRSEIEAVDPEVFIEFAAQHQGALPGHHRSGADGLYEAVSQLQGFDLPAGVWESDVLPLRVDNYQPGLLDQLCLSGEAGWGRLDPPGRRPNSSRPMSSMTRAIPVSLFLREDFAWLAGAGPSGTESSETPDVDPLSASAREVLDLLFQEKALFSSDIAQRLKLLPSQLHELLGELAAGGRLTADGFGGLRQLIRNQSDTSQRGIGSRSQRVRAGGAGQGRWSLLTEPESPAAGEADEAWAWQLIRRWGVVFRELAVREPLSPPWWRLTRVYRRLEARGELRGGRFVRGVGGEQYALSEAIRELRTIRRRERTPQLLIMSAADPLNLTGVIGNSPRIPSQASHRIAWRAGRVVGWKKADETWISPELPVDDQLRLSSQWGVVERNQDPAFRIEDSEESRRISAALNETPPSTLDSGHSTPLKPQLPPVVNIHTPAGGQKRRQARRSGIPRPYPF